MTGGSGRLPTGSTKNNDMPTAWATFSNLTTMLEGLQGYLGGFLCDIKFSTY
jgi:hypothetical protein